MSEDFVEPFKPTSPAARRRALELEAGRKAHEQQKAALQAELGRGPTPSVAAVVVEETASEAVTLSIPGVSDYVSGQVLVSDEPLSQAEVVAAVVEQAEDVEEPAPALPPSLEETNGVPTILIVDNATRQPVPNAYTLEDLRERAKAGIKYLREIATPLGIKGTQKEELIREIVEAQGVFTYVAPEAEVAPVEPAPAGDLDATLDDLLN